MRKKPLASKTTSKKPTIRKKTAALKSKTGSASGKQARIFGLKLRHAGGITLLIIGIIWGAFIFASQPSETSTASGCTPDARLVNPCRPWLGAAVNGYNTGGLTQFQFFNTRLNNANALTSTSLRPTLTYKLDVPHVYHSPNQNLFNSVTKETLADGSIYGNTTQPILINWKPGGSSWAATASGNSDDELAQAVTSVKALGARKIMLALWHEPENDNVNATGVSITGSCKKPTGTNGSAADYRAMYQHVHDYFVNRGVTNVVWVWNPMGYVGSDGNGGWACIEDALYPGNKYVDWVMWDPYSDSGGAGSFYNSVNRFYSFLQNHDDNGAHDYSSKPWGLAEHGSNAPQSDVIAYYQDGVKTIGTNWAENKFQNIKLYAIFDTSNNGGTNGGLRVGYDLNGNLDTKEQAAYNAFAKNILNFYDPPVDPTPPPSTTDTIPPTITLDSPADGAAVKGNITVKGTAKDNVKVKAVTLRIDDNFVGSDDTAPYNFSVDTTKYSNGKHTIVLRAWDPTDNMGESKTITVSFQNGTKGATNTTTATSTTTATTQSTTTITTATTTDSSTGITVTGTLVVSPTVAGNSVQIWVDGKLQPNNTVDSTWLTNGTHQVRIVENGLSSMKLVSVKNPLPVAALNAIRTNAISYSAVAGVVLAALLFWIFKPYVVGLTSWRERNITRLQRRVK